MIENFNPEELALYNAIQAYEASGLPCHYALEEIKEELVTQANKRKLAIVWELDAKAVQWVGCNSKYSFCISIETSSGRFYAQRWPVNGDGHKVWTFTDSFEQAKRICDEGNFH